MRRRFQELLARSTSHFGPFGGAKQLRELPKNLYQTGGTVIELAYEKQ
jgi:hypothetical protein